MFIISGLAYLYLCQKDWIYFTAENLSGFWDKDRVYMIYGIILK